MNTLCMKVLRRFRSCGALIALLLLSATTWAFAIDADCLLEGCHHDMGMTSTCHGERNFCLSSTPLPLIVTCDSLVADVTFTQPPCTFFSSAPDDRARPVPSDFLRNRHLLRAPPSRHSF
ncbi:MAG: hypothetical protein RDV48_19405 [Candidatus Eremiobacteraeota bacterium]|nr:hypothetical protein [Candidatus Eremiobacteraeota bacterium]